MLKLGIIRNQEARSFGCMKSMRKNTKPPTKPKRKNIILLLSLVIIFAAVIMQVLIAIQTTANGAELSVLEKNKEELLAQQRELKSKLVESSSATTLSLKAEDMGYAKVDQTHFIVVDTNYSALKND